MEDKICSLFGHRQFSVSQAKKEDVKKEIVRLIENEGVNVFYLGGKGIFDEFCATYIFELKKKYPHIKSFLIIAYLNEKMSEYDEDRIKKIYNGTIYPDIEKVPLKFAILKRNEWMINRSSLCLFYLNWSWGGAYKTFEVAKRKHKRYINLGDLEI